MRRPRVETRCVADQYAAAGERIVEISGGSKGAGCLLALRFTEDGNIRLDVYRTEGQVEVVVDPQTVAYRNGHKLVETPGQPEKGATHGR